VNLLSGFLGFGHVAQQVAIEGGRTVGTRRFGSLRRAEIHIVEESFSPTAPCCVLQSGRVGVWRLVGDANLLDDEIDDLCVAQLLRVWDELA
jgi:hypothetical protein